MYNDSNSIKEELEKLKTEIRTLQLRNKELEDLCMRDALTGLYNWRHFSSMLENEVARNIRQKHPISLIFFDVDNLKAHNDTHGHSGGNEVLKAVARCVAQSIRKHVDSAYRFGGDEFAIILPEIRSEMATEIARRIMDRLSESGFRDVSLSFGIAELEPGMDSNDLLNHADEAMYISKSESINKINVYK